MHATASCSTSAPKRAPTAERSIRHCEEPGASGNGSTHSLPVTRGLEYMRLNTTKIKGVPVPPIPRRIEEIIDKKVGEVRVEGLDLSFGEIMSLLSNKELDLYPDFQRYFRWSDEQ